MESIRQLGDGNSWREIAKGKQADQGGLQGDDDFLQGKEAKKMHVHHWFCASDYGYFSSGLLTRPETSIKTYPNCNILK